MAKRSNDEGGDEEQRTADQRTDRKADPQLRLSVQVWLQDLRHLRLHKRGRSQVDTAGLETAANVGSIRHSFDPHPTRRISLVP